ncbi:hypothetical protein [Parapoynx stagnalis nucleopolyhedrovirus]|uniref:Ac52 n=1 Tax=Parapoynx stagnalis nucleopolyhedrovirus TaxID=2993413 RepID=A0A9E8BW46_9ABAC|nr:hypothetical protein [Parapoynx stagnalis nucleopolyhedrovirus]
MTTLTSTSFKLIKAFKKYSTNYKNCASQRQRLILYHMWLKDVKEEMMNYDYQNMSVYCEQCTSETTANEYLCCRTCLFPIIDDFNGRYELTCQQQLNLFALLSVCYWEERSKSDNFEEENTKFIWKQRLRIAWFSINRDFVCFFDNANCFVCFQCSTHNTRALKYYKVKVKTFDENYFCEKCLFPLFDKLLYI